MNGYYLPAEDSSLLANVVSHNIKESDSFLDVGTGSGYISLEIKGKCSRVISSDINVEACKQAILNLDGVVMCDLSNAFKENSFDIVAFNPPYLPKDGNEFEEWFDLATVGGETGREVIERFLDDVKRILTLDGSVFLLVSTETGIQEIKEYAETKGFFVDVVAEDTYPSERLVVLRLIQS
jgi:release factor glutamine methyltransferase